MKTSGDMDAVLCRAWPVVRDDPGHRIDVGPCATRRTVEALARRGLVALALDGATFALTDAGREAAHAVYVVRYAKCGLCGKFRQNASISETHPACRGCLDAANVRAAMEAVHGEVEPCEVCRGAREVEAPRLCECGDGCGCTVLHRATRMVPCTACKGAGWFTLDDNPVPRDDGPRLDFNRRRRSGRNEVSA